MILTTNNSGEHWTFDEGECADYAYICSCMPTDRMTYREIGFIGRMETKFRNGSAGWLTPGQWTWFTRIAQKYSRFIQGQEFVAEDVRKLAARAASGEL